jgi:phosphoesterase RecJ-like protein
VTELDLPRLARALREAVDRAATILVASEPMPDGDAFSSELAVRFAIEGACGLAATRAEARSGKGPKYVAVLNERGTPDRYAFLDGASAARAPDDDDRRGGFDLGILVDGGVERCGPTVRALYEGCGVKAYFDHHHSGSRSSYDVPLVDPTRASTTELIFGLLETEAWRDVPLTRPLAEAIYTGLLSDTNSFIYSLTTPRTHQVAARLLEAGARSSLIGERVILDIDERDLRLSARVLDSLATELGGKLHVAVMTLGMLEGRAPHLVGYDKIVTPIAFVKGSKVTLLLREVEAHLWKISLRSRGEVDVAALARELDPEGGGHARAAGCTLEGPLDAVRGRATAAIARALGRAGL